MDKYVVDQGKEQVEKLKILAESFKELLKNNNLETFIIWCEHDFNKFFEMNPHIGDIKEFKEKYFIEIYCKKLFIGMFSFNRTGQFIELL
jgi:hypothetical protein